MAVSARRMRPNVRGPLRVICYRNAMSALRPLFPNSDHIADAPTRRKSAMKRLMHRSNYLFHSITSSARSRNDSGIVRPSAFAVLRLIISSNLVGCSTGSSLGRAPLRILSASAALR